MQLTLIICSRNRATKLARCLDSIKPDRFFATRLETILVNNGSTDNTSQVMLEFKQTTNLPVTIIEEPTRGLGIARNAGLKRARGDVIAFTDDDCCLSDDYFQTLIGLFQSNRFQYCGGRILRLDLSDSLYACDESEAMKVFPPCTVLEPGEIQGANMVFQKKVVQNIGPFDPMFGAGTAFRCEDIDYCVRASLAGFTGAYVPQLVVYHHHGLGNDISAEDNGDSLQFI